MKKLPTAEPNLKRKQSLKLWCEFEKGESADARFAKAIDRVLPLLHNLHDDGHSWKNFNISGKQVLELNGERIARASRPLWSCLENKLNRAIEDGILS
ncbi:HD domain-containing protein [Dongshaea marina]|uniref:HD domain-containing protein n=1 Tax=Dongshaea marina TaxID=2047966 RepID=UPI000D3ED81B|nr:HD domain-containing protein [Dongshaea marina]